MMRKYGNCLLNIQRTILLSVVILASLSTTMLTAALEPGESLYAEIFTGIETNTSLGNPKDDGQGWYKGDGSSLLKYYTMATAPYMKWGLSDTSSSVYTNGSPTQFTFAGKENTGLLWAYSNQYNAAVYEVSADSISKNYWGRYNFAVKTNSESSWVSLGSSKIYTNIVLKGGAIGFVGRRSSYNANVYTTGLKVKLLEVLDDTPAVTLSVSTNKTSESSPYNIMYIIANLSENTSKDVEINLNFGGSAVLDTDYALSTNKLFIAGGTSLSASAVITNIDNYVINSDKTIDVSLGTLVNATNGIVTSQSVTILDDERAISQPGDTVYASIFMGENVGTTDTNPNLAGQEWSNVYGIKFKYYEDSVRWGSSEFAGTDLSYSVVGVDTTVPNTIKTYDRNSKRGCLWTYTASKKGSYELSFSELYSYPNGGGNPQVWKVGVYKDGAWNNLIDYQNVTSNSKGGGSCPGTNFVAELYIGDVFGFYMKTGGSSYNGGSGRIYDLKVQLLPPNGSLIIIQ